MEITVAGAGSGKTTNMSKKIVELRKNQEDNKIIYCITFTNNAVTRIKEKLQKHYGEIPNNIVVSTIHSFLYQEFIKPYYYLVYNKHYERIATGNLPDNPVYKKSVIQRLETVNVIHQTVIPERAKWVISKKTTDKKDIKLKKEIIRKNFLSYCGAICIDEAQDIDVNMLEIIKTLNNLGVYIIAVGDPKQDLRGHKCFKKLVALYPQNVNYLDLCHRCPQSHIALSNIIVEEAEKQKSNKTTGDINIYFETEKSIDELIDKNNYDLIYISQRQGIYETHIQYSNANVRDMLYEEISQLIKKNNPNISKLEVMRNSFYMAESLLKNYERFGDKKMAMNKTFKSIKLNEFYGRIIGCLPSKTNKEKSKEFKINVNSIDSIKGQEGKNCLFILTTDIAEYLFNKKDDTTFKNKLYVALTRSLEKITIYITAPVEKKYKKENIEQFFKEHKISVKY